MADFGDGVKSMPKWVWIVGIGLGAFVLWHYRSSLSGMLGGSSSTATSPQMQANTTGSAVAPSAGATSFGSNTDWESALLTNAAAFGSTPIDAQQAADTYLNGGQLSSQQAALINQAVESLGAPPQGTTGTPTIAPATGASTPAAPSAPWYTPPANDIVVQASSAGSKGLLNTQTGKLVSTFTPSEFFALRDVYGNNIKIQNVSSTTAKRIGLK